MAKSHLLKLINFRSLTSISSLSTTSNQLPKLSPLLRSNKLSQHQLKKRHPLRRLLHPSQRKKKLLRKSLLKRKFQSKKRRLLLQLRKRAQLSHRPRRHQPITKMLRCRKNKWLRHKLKLRLRLKLKLKLRQRLLQ